MNLTSPSIPTDLREKLDRRRARLSLVRALLVDELRVDRDPASIDADTPLFGSGLSLDSVDAVELIAALERVFGVVVAKDRHHMHVLRTPNTICDHLEGVLDAG